MTNPIYPLNIQQILDILPHRFPLRDGRPGAERGRRCGSRHQKRVDGRTAFPGPLSAGTGHAGRADHRGAGAGEHVLSAAGTGHHRLSGGHRGRTLQAQGDSRRHAAPAYQARLLPARIWARPSAAPRSTGRWRRRPRFCSRSGSDGGGGRGACGTWEVGTGPVILECSQACPGCFFFPQSPLPTSQNNDPHPLPHPRTRAAAAGGHAAVHGDSVVRVLLRQRAVAGWRAHRPGGEMARLPDSRHAGEGLSDERSC